MAKKKLHGAALAESRVRDQGADAAQVYSLPVNYDFEEPNVVDRERGVDYPDAPENRQAEQGTARHVFKQLQPANLQTWIRGIVAHKGGTDEAARTLLAMDTPNPTVAQFKAQRRKVQEWSKGVYSHAARQNARRVALLRLTQAKHLVIGVRGWWHIEDDEKFRVFNSDPRESQHVREAIEILKADGVGFIETVIIIAAEYVQPYAPELISVHELRVEVSV